MEVAELACKTPWVLWQCLGIVVWEEQSVGLMMGISSVLVMEFCEVISPLTMTGQVFPHLLSLP